MPDPSASTLRLSSEPPRHSDADRVLRTIFEGTAEETGSAFFQSLVQAVAEALGVKGAWVTEFTDGGERLRALAFWMDGDFVEDFEYAVPGTPCEDVVRECRLVHVPDRVVDLYPGDPDLKTMIRAVSYMGVPLLNSQGEVFGNLAILHDEPLEQDPRAEAVFQIFAARAGAELRRLRAEEKVRAREKELALLVGSAMDGIVEFGPQLEISRANRAAARTFRIPENELSRRNLTRLLSPSSRVKLRRLMEEVDARPDDQRSLWVSGGLEGIRADGEEFPAEGTLSSFQIGGRRCYTLILRDVNDRREAERRLRHLSAETEYLREELEALEEFGEIVGQSEPLLEMLRQIQEVAPTDATVLILGETGTGKELVARAIHEASPRSERTLVRVNCAAIPESLIESEFFGHEKGAFTGATSRREGRFAVADRGTIFLDEVGELPLELQAKLLRVLQEGEFEPVGSERTRTVDVRVIAATNRFLEAAVRAGHFREDLYYRLNVFPVVVPPLRDRGDDVILLAETFLERFARRIGRTVHPLLESDRNRLRAYSWPGNVRELQNIMERAVITARRGRVDLARILPDEAVVEGGRVGEPGDPGGNRIMTDAEIKEL